MHTLIFTNITKFHKMQDLCLYIQFRDTAADLFKRELDLPTQHRPLWVNSHSKLSITLTDKISTFFQHFSPFGFTLSSKTFANGVTRLVSLTLLLYYFITS